MVWIFNFGSRPFYPIFFEFTSKFIFFSPYYFIDEEFENDLVFSNEEALETIINIEKVNDSLDDSDLRARLKKEIKKKKRNFKWGRNWFSIWLFWDFRRSWSTF